MTNRNVYVDPNSQPCKQKRVKMGAAVLMIKNHYNVYISQPISTSIQGFMMFVDYKKSFVSS